MSCEMCKRDLITTSHHLIPKQIHSKNWCKKKFTRAEMKSRRAELCRDCHLYLDLLYLPSSNLLRLTLDKAMLIFFFCSFVSIMLSIIKNN